MREKKLKEIGMHGHLPCHQILKQKKKSIKNKKNTSSSVLNQKTCNNYNKQQAIKCETALPVRGAEGRLNNGDISPFQNHRLSPSCSRKTFPLATSSNSCRDRWRTIGRFVVAKVHSCRRLASCYVHGSSGSKKGRHYHGSNHFLLRGWVQLWIVRREGSRSKREGKEIEEQG